MQFILDNLILALAYTPLAIGITISFRIAKFTDLTVDGSFAAGGGLTAFIIVQGYTELSLLAAMFIGMFAGSITAMIHIVFKTSKILAGIINMFALYSFSILIMGSPNIQLISQTPLISSSNTNFDNLKLLIPIIGVIVIILFIFFKTEKGLHLIAHGQNINQFKNLGRNPNQYIFASLIMANSLIALSGGLMASYQGFADVNMGVGQLITGLAVLYLGQLLTSFIFKNENQYNVILAAIAGIIIYQFLISLSYAVGVKPLYHKVITGIIILLPMIIKKILRDKFELEEII